MEECLRCLGSGWDIIFEHRKVNCPQCDGSLKITDLVACPECKGTGQANKPIHSDPELTQIKWTLRPN